MVALGDPDEQADMSVIDKLTYSNVCVFVVVHYHVHAHSNITSEYM